MLSILDDTGVTCAAESAPLKRLLEHPDVVKKLRRITAAPNRHSALFEARKDPKVRAPPFLHTQATQLRRLGSNHLESFYLLSSFGVVTLHFLS